MNLRDISLTVLFVLAIGMTGCSGTPTTVEENKTTTVEGNATTTIEENKTTIPQRYESAVLVIDISDLAYPTKLGSVGIDGNSFYSITLSSDGRKAYVVDENGLIIVDIGDPIHPTKLGSYDTVGNVYEVTLSSDGT